MRARRDVERSNLPLLGYVKSGKFKVCTNSGISGKLLKALKKFFKNWENLDSEQATSR